ncbi:uncharacterized protein SAPINGB_P002801 [Magnusiomyces paraingens]|uniref:Uncharacterized protein n=1 Tax=Magnusiomyces paraingens TaxID=2606893 RepID=A0A5E8BI40_9ASCO|nr:uncharacterized protein SAPINGB_P002801 [Saprochaete ingens]VVT50552.1 unnamed protein product [Saprochaete ingens]
MFNPYKTKNLDPSVGFTPRRTSGFLSTPQKKLVLYIVALLIIGGIILTSINMNSDSDDTILVRKNPKRPLTEDPLLDSNDDDLFAYPGENDDKDADLD